MTTRPLSFVQLAAVVIANGLEFYDFLIFGFFAVQIGQAFFPAAGDAGLLLTLATFGVGFLTRPLGGFVIGSLGDRIGRKPTMLFSFGLMGVSVTGLALTPSYAAIGMAAPLLAVLFRLLQGFALGGEVGPATAFLLEAAPPNRRALYVSLQFATQQASTLIAGLAGLLLANLMSNTALNDWGWRIAMLAGAALVPVGLIIRNRLPETLAEKSTNALPRLPARQIWLAALGLFTLVPVTIATYTMNYMVTFGTHTLGLQPRLAFGATVATGFCGTIFNILGGILADRYGRKPVMLISFGLLLMVALPCFTLMANSGTPLALYAGSALMASFMALGSPATLTALSENLPTLSRSGGVGIVYALAISVFGGTAQFVVTWAIGVLHSPLAPAWYLSASVILGLAAMLALPVRTAS